jgi:hypothetical protein
MSAEKIGSPGKPASDQRGLPRLLNEKEWPSSL